MRYVFALIVILYLAGCSSPRETVREAAHPPADSAAEAAEEELVQTAAESRKREAALSKQIAKLQAEKAEEHENGLRLQSEENKAQARRLFAWIAGIAAIGALACTAIAIFLPFLRGRAIVGVLACLGLALAAFALRAAVAYLWWIAGALIGGGALTVMVLLWENRKHHVAISRVAKYFSGSLHTLPSEVQQVFSRHETKDEASQEHG